MAARQQLHRPTPLGALPSRAPCTMSVLRGHALERLNWQRTISTQCRVQSYQGCKGRRVILDCGAANADHLRTSIEPGKNLN